MKRLTTDDSQSILYGLNLFFGKDREVWIRGGGPEPDYQDCTLVDYIGRVAETHHLDIVSRDAEHLGDEMYDCLQYGTDELEGVVALLHAAAIQAAEMRGRLADIEDILGASYDLDRLRELVEADRDGRCVVLPCKVGDRVWVTSAYGKQYNPPIEGHIQKLVVHDDEIVYLEAIIWMDIGCGHKGYGYTEKSFGKAVFLTPEDAKATLKGGQDA